MNDPLADESPIFRDRHAFLIFCVCVAGKRGAQTLAKVEQLVQWLLDPPPPPNVRLLDRVRQYDWVLASKLRELRLGQYKRIAGALNVLSQLWSTKVLDPDNPELEPDDLEAVSGIGPKTARYFLLRAHGKHYAALDTHVLKWLRSQGYKAPRSTPQSRKVYCREAHGSYQTWRPCKSRERATACEASIDPPCGDGWRYSELECAFLNEAFKRGLTPDELDARVWQHYAQGAAYPE
jgi:hypothetical protein